VVVLPAVAASEPLPVEAVNEGAYYHHWSNAQQTVIAGESVKFGNPGSEVPHGLKFTGGPGTQSCSGIPVAATEASGATDWHGECTFTTPGTYTFICTVHPSEMKGTITVNPNGTTTTTITPTPTPTTTTTTPTTTTPTPVEPPTPLLSSLSIRPSQHGGTVKGSLELSKAGAGAGLEIDVLAHSTSLVKTMHTARVRVGRLTRGSLSAGELSFAVKLDAEARKALERHGRLALTVKITITPVHGKPLTLTRPVVEHA
jgi:plastocyanin